MNYLIIPPRGLASSLGTLFVTNVNSKNGALSITGGSGISIDNTGLSEIVVNVTTNVVQSNLAVSFSAPVTLSSVIIPLAASAPGSPTNGNLYYNTSNSELQLYYSSSWVVLNATGGSIGGTLSGGPNTGSLLFVGSAGVLTQNTNLVVKTTSGVQVGIGTSTPSTALQVIGTVKSTALLATSLATATTPGANLVTSDGSGNLIAALPSTVIGSVGVLQGTNTGPLVINSTNTMTLSGAGLLGVYIDNSGNVGIGTNVVTTKLTVLGNIQATNIGVSNVGSIEKGEDVVLSGSSQQLACKSLLDFAGSIVATLTTTNNTIDPTGRVVIQLTTGSPWLSTDRMALTTNKGHHTQTLVLQWVNSVTAPNPILVSGGNILLTANWVPAQNNILVLMYICNSIGTAGNWAGTWCEISRSAI